MLDIDDSAWIHESAQLFGHITIGAESSVWPNVVMRAESQPITIGRYSNVQDLVMIHIGYGNPTVVGDFCSVTHHATVHGCVIEDDVLIGINAVVMDGAVIGRGSIVAPGAVVTERTIIPPHSIVAGVPGKVIKSRDCTIDNRMNAWSYWFNAQGYRVGDYHRWESDEYTRFFAEKRAEMG